MRVAFLGLGRMGQAMAAHVLAAGHELVVWNRSPGRAGDLLAAGAFEARTPAEAASTADVVATMLFGPESVQEVLLGHGGVAEGARPGTLNVDATTVGPAAARAFGSALTDRGLRYADTPVAGSTQPARDGTLGVLVGCAEADWAEVEPVVSLWGDRARVRRVGDVGAGSALKLCVNQGIGVLAAGLGETLRLGRELGLDRTQLLDVLGTSPYGWVLGQKRAMLDAGDFTATTFSLDLLAKDLDLVTSAGSSPLPVTAAASAAARGALAAGHSDEHYAALVAWLAG